MTPAGTPHGTPPSVLDVEDLAVTFRSEAGDVSAVRGISLSGTRRRGAGHRRRVGVGQVRVVAGRHGPAAGERAGHGLGSLSRARPDRTERSGAVRYPGPAHLDDLPGPAVGAHAGLHRRRSDRRGDPGCTTTSTRHAAHARAVELLALVGIPNAARSARRRFRTSSRAACASA